MTTSLKVAKVFGKEHKHVLRDIEKLDCSADFRASNFGLTEIEVQAGAVKRKSPVYLMTTSLKVAEVFGKNHRDVTREIDKLVAKGVRNFTQTS